MLRSIGWFVGFVPCAKRESFGVSPPDKVFTFSSWRLRLSFTALSKKANNDKKD